MGAALAALGIALAGIGSNLLTYQRLSHERPVAEISFERLAPQRYLARVDLAGAGEPRHFELYGEEWQIDARVLKWHSVGNLLGLDSHYRLERISGRYRSIEQERSATRSVYTLAERQPLSLDLWSWANAHPHWLPWVDAVYGSAAYLPMRDGARYQISLSQSGLIARPLTAATDPRAR